MGTGEKGSKEQPFEEPHVRDNNREVSDKAAASMVWLGRLPVEKATDTPPPNPNE